MLVPVVTAAQAAALDSASIAAGNPSRALMQRAGAAAAGEITRRYPEAAARGVAVYTGPGNNGGDAWVVAAALAAVGIPLTIREVRPPVTPDAIAERARTLQCVQPEPPTGSEGVIVDGLLGTGARGTPRGEVAEGIRDINAARQRGALVVALDLPSGLDADTGAEGESVLADLTISFGSARRGTLVNRGRCGNIIVVDIGLGPRLPGPDRLPRLIDHRWVRSSVPRIAHDAHKGSRGRIAVVGGAPGMAGAVVLAARGALRSGAGLVKVALHSESLGAAQAQLPEALSTSWPFADILAEISSWAHVIAVGPGLGSSDTAASLIAALLRSGDAPILLDADALNIIALHPTLLKEGAARRTVLITPHAGEMARLTDSTPELVLQNRFEVTRDFAAEFGCTVLLKGVPTVIADPRGAQWVSAAGSAVLATGGSGDVLAGIAATLLAQIPDAARAGACAAWIHGAAAEGALSGRRSVRSGALHDVLDELPALWDRSPSPPVAPVLADLPRLPE